HIQDPERQVYVEIVVSNCVASLVQRLGHLPPSMWSRTTQRVFTRDAGHSMISHLLMHRSWRPVIVHQGGDENGRRQRKKCKAGLGSYTGQLISSFAGYFVKSPVWITDEGRRPNSRPDCRRSQLLDGSMSLSPLYSGKMNDLHVSVTLSLHRDFSWLHSSQV